MSVTLTKEMFKALAPKAKNADELYEAMVDLLPKYKIDTPNRIAMFFAQCGHESGEFTITVENLNYSADGLNKIFPKYFVRAGRDAQAYHRQPEKIANVVYAGRMDNGDEKSGDGWTFRGAGYIQLTGRYNHTQFGKTVGMTAEQAADYAKTPKGALESACWFWTTNDINKYADANDIVGSTKRINGGTIGLDDRKKHYAHALEVLGGKVDFSVDDDDVVTYNIIRKGSKGEQVKMVQEKLGISADGDFGPGTEAAVKAWQRENGLTPDGIIGPKSMAKLLG